jgi:SAP domain-containing new25/Domain of unknown function (DUF6434)
MTNKYNPKSGIVSNIKIDSIQKFQATYYYKYELVQFCMANEIPYSGLMKFDLERNIITFLKGEVRFIKPKLRIKNWVQDKLGLGCEVTTNYKNNSQTRAFFVSVIGSKFRFSGAMMKYKEYNPELYYLSRFGKYLVQGK